MARREFHFVEGTSSKFWAVTVEDSTLRIQYGKIGSAGQTQLKSFASPAEAEKGAAKLIAEKAGKGYVEVGSPTPAAPAAPPKPAAVAEAAVAKSAVERRIRLPAAELNPVAPKPPLTPARPFDLAALEAKVKAANNHPYPAYDAPRACSAEEARFWLRSCGFLGQVERCVEPASMDELKRAFTSMLYHPLALSVFENQFVWADPADLIELAVHVPFFTHSGLNAAQLVPWLREEVWPRLAAASMERVRAKFRQLLANPDSTTAFAAAVLARDAGVGAEVLALVQDLSPEALPDRFQQLAWHCILLSLDDPAEIVAQHRRLGVRVHPAAAKAYLARTKYLGLDLLAESIPHAGVADDQVKMLGVLLLVEAPEAAPPILSVKLQTKSNRLAGKAAEWLDKHREHAAAGLAPLAEQKGPLADAARAWLDDHRKRQQGSAADSPKHEKAPPAAKANTPPAPVAMPAPERRMNLAPEDHQRAKAPERPSARPAAPAPRKLDLAALKKARKEDVRPPDCAVTPEEARFWLLSWGLSLGGYSEKDRNALLAPFTAESLGKPLALEEVKRGFENLHFWRDVTLPALRLQRTWMAPADLAEVVACHPIPRYSPDDAASLGDWLVTEVCAGLDEAGMKPVRDRLVALMGGGDATVACIAAVLAWRFGMAAEALAFVSKQKKLPSGWASATFGIADRERLVKEVRRLGVKLGYVTEARVWLALTGHDALDVLRDSILATRKAADALALLDVLLLAESPEAAVALFEIKVAGKPAGADARIAAWLRAHADHALAGLTLLAGEGSPRGEAARAFLASAAPAGGGAPPPPGDAPADAGKLRALLDSVEPGKAPPGFADPATLPPLMGLPSQDVCRVLTALRSSTLAGPHPLVAALRRDGDRAALEAFAWQLFSGWLDAGAPSKEKWALLALGHFGHDVAVSKLAPLIRAWPGESQHQRAVTGLEVLRTIGTDLALTQLNGMALKLKFKALQERARAMMDAIAADRGLSREQLEDRIVPDLGLDADGGCTFDFGPRRFRFTLGPDLAPVVSDESGKPLKDLPKPGAKDDAAKAAEAVAAWKALKAQLRQTLKIQIMRLEEAMITGRTWTPQEFHELLVRHPLMMHLVRRLVWEGGGLFRVAERGEAVSAEGTQVKLEGVPSVRIAHRLRLTPAQIDAWRKALDAQGLEAPFPQMERSVFTPRADEAQGTDFVRMAETVPAAKVRGTLEERGWRRLMHDQGGITGFSKAYPAAGLTAVVVLDGTIVIGMMDGGDRRVQQAFFVTGTNHPHGPCSDEFHRGMARVRLADVDAVAFSETANDLTLLAPSGKG